MNRVALSTLLVLFARAGAGPAAPPSPYAPASASAGLPSAAPSRTAGEGVPTQAGPEAPPPAGPAASAPAAVLSLPDAGRPHPVPPAAAGPWAPACGCLANWQGHGDVPGRCWADLEYLRWWVKSGPVAAPLASTESGSVLLGGSSVDFGAFSGGRLTLGAWLDEAGAIGVEARGLLLERRLLAPRFSSDELGNPGLGVPFFNVLTGKEDLAGFASPNNLVGTVQATFTSQLWGAEGSLFVNAVRLQTFTLNALAGFRYAGLQENLTLAANSAPLPGVGVAFAGAVVPPPAITGISDRFQAQNHFYGGQIGAVGECQHGPFVVTVAGRLALGATHQIVNVAGESSLSIGPVGPVRTVPGGLFAQPSNIGRLAADAFAVIPEVEAKVAYQVTKHIRAHVGYNFLYWSSVVRPGGQINRNLNPSQAPTFGEFGTQVGPAQPAPLLSTTDFWAQGLSAGVEFRY